MQVLLSCRTAGTEGSLKKSIYQNLIADNCNKFTAKHGAAPPSSGRVYLLQFNPDSMPAFSTLVVQNDLAGFDCYSAQWGLFCVGYHQTERQNCGETYSLSFWCEHLPH